MKRLVPLIIFIAASAHAETVVEGVGPVTGDEVAAFQSADLDADGSLDFEEFRAFVGYMADSGQSTARLVRMLGAYRIAFNRVDRDGDGLAMPTELRRADDAHRAEGG